MEEQIVYEDNHLLVVNKKVGQLVQGDKTGDESLLESIKNFIKIRDNKPGNVFLGLVHPALLFMLKLPKRFPVLRRW